MKKFIIQLGVFSIFTDTKFIFPPGSYSFDFYDYYFIFIAILLYYIITQRNLRIMPSWFLKGIIIFLIGSCIGAAINDYFEFPFYKTIFGILFSSISYYLVFKLADFDLKLLIRYYLKFAFLISIFGLLQEALSFTGTLLFFGAIAKAAGGKLYRVTSTSGEPYFLSTVLLPAIIYYSYIFFGASNCQKLKITGDKMKAFVISLCFALTFSTAGFFIFFIGIILMTIDKGRIDGWGYRIIYLPIVAFLIYVTSTYLSEKDANYQKRVNDSFFVVNKATTVKDLNNLNSSSFSLVSNYYIFKKSFETNPIFGTGIGTYEFVYNKFFDKIFGNEFRKKYLDQNSKDGNSLFIRLLTETGIWGFTIFMLFIFKNSTFNLKNWRLNQLTLYSIMNQAILIFFLIRLLRTGNYIGQGFFFFFFLYYYDKHSIEYYLKKLPAPLYRKFSS